MKASREAGIARVSPTGAIQCEHILIANTAEAFAIILRQALKSGGGERRVQQELALSQRAYFWRGDRKVVVTPMAVPTPLMEAAQSQLGFTSVVNVAPTSVALELSRTVKEEKRIYDRLCEVIDSNAGVVLSPYGVTDDFLALVDQLRADGLEFDTPEVPDGTSRWLPKHLDSKCGFREAICQSACGASDIRLPLGFRCEELAKCAEAVEWFLGRGDSCVLKVDVGESGWGLRKFVGGAGRGTTAWEILQQIARGDSIWGNPPYLVEKYISPGGGRGGSSPSVEAYVGEGGVQLLYSCDQLLSPEGEFSGIAIGPELLPRSLTTRLERATSEIGKIFWRLGYRGFFDVDFVVDGESVAFAVEANTRRTGGTHVFDILARLSELSTESPRWAISDDSFCYGESVLAAETILERVQPLMYPLSDRPLGLIITLVNPAQPLLGYVLVGREESEVLALQEEFYSLWRS